MLNSGAGALAWDARVGGLEVPGDVGRARLEVAQRRVHDAQLAAARPAAAVGVERRQGVDRAADVAEVLAHAASDRHAAVARRLHQHDRVGPVAAGCERLLLTVLDHVA